MLINTDHSSKAYSFLTEEFDKQWLHLVVQTQLSTGVITNLPECLLKRMNAKGFYLFLYSIALTTLSLSSQHLVSRKLDLPTERILQTITL